MERRGQVEAVLTVTLTDYHREEQQNRIESNVIELTRYYRAVFFIYVPSGQYLPTVSSIHQKITSKERQRANP